MIFRWPFCLTNSFPCLKEDDTNPANHGEPTQSSAAPGDHCFHHGSAWPRKDQPVLRLRQSQNSPDAANPPSIDGGPPDPRCYWKSSIRRLPKSWLNPKVEDLSKDLATMLRKVWRLWRTESMGPLYRLILSEMMLEKEGARYLREVFIPRRQAFTGLAFQAAKDRGEIPADTDVKLLIDLLYGYSLFRLITRQIEDDEIPDRSRRHCRAFAARIPRSIKRRSARARRWASGRIGVWRSAKGRIGDAANGRTATVTPR